MRFVQYYCFVLNVIIVIFYPFSFYDMLKCCCFLESFFPQFEDFRFLVFLVAVPPEIIKEPQNISIDEGDTIILECEARGLPVPQITWYLNGSAMSTNSSLVEIIEAIKSEHEGLYRCEAENPAGIVTASAFVTVRGQYNGYTFVIILDISKFFQIALA